MDLPFDALLKFVAMIPRSDDMRTWCCLARFAKTCTTAKELVKAVVDHPETSDIASPPQRVFHAVYVKACPQLQGEPVSSATLNVGFKGFKPYVELSVTTNRRRIAIQFDPVGKGDKHRGALQRLERPGGWHRLEKQDRDPTMSHWFEYGKDRFPYILRMMKDGVSIYYLDSGGNDGLQPAVTLTDQRAVIEMELRSATDQEIADNPSLAEMFKYEPGTLRITLEGFLGLDAFNEYMDDVNEEFSEDVYINFEAPELRKFLGFDRDNTTLIDDYLRRDLGGKKKLYKDLDPDKEAARIAKEAELHVDPVSGRTRRKAACKADSNIACTSKELEKSNKCDEEVYQAFGESATIPNWAGRSSRNIDTPASDLESSGEESEASGEESDAAPDAALGDEAKPQSEKGKSLMVDIFGDELDDVEESDTEESDQEPLSPSLKHFQPEAATSHPPNHNTMSDPEDSDIEDTPAKVAQPAKKKVVKKAHLVEKAAVETIPDHDVVPMERIKHAVVAQWGPMMTSRSEHEVRWRGPRGEKDVWVLKSRRRPQSQIDEARGKRKNDIYLFRPKGKCARTIAQAKEFLSERAALDAAEGYSVLENEE